MSSASEAIIFATDEWFSEVKSTFLISLVVALQLLGLLATQLIVIKVIGVSPETDVFTISQALPAILTSVITTALYSVWLPKFSVLAADYQQFNHAQSLAQGQAFIISAVFALIFGITAFIWFPMIYPGLSQAQSRMGVTFSIILLIATIFNAQSAMLTAGLRGQGRFVASELLSLVGTLGSLFFIWLSLSKYGLSAVIWLLLLRSIIIYLLQMHYANWPSISVVSILNNRENWSLLKPSFLSISLYKSAPLVDRYWASQAPSGGVTIFNLSQTLISGIATVLERSISTPITPTISRLVSSRDYFYLNKIIKKKILRITFLSVLILSVFILSKPVFVQATKDLMHLPDSVVDDLWIITLCFMGFLYSAMISPILVAVYYANKDTKTPAWVAGASFCLGALLKFAFFESFGLRSLAIVTSICITVNNVIFYIGIQRMMRKMKIENEV